MKKIIILSTDTPHHRYFINKIQESGVSIHSIYFETTHVQPSFETGPLFEDKELEYENDNFFKDISNDISNYDIRHCKNINNISEDLVNLKPDLGLVFGTRKLSSELINNFKDGLLNVHRGMAEEYRGLDSDLWAIYHHDYDNIGVTIHKVIPELDKGSIIAEKRMRVHKKMKIWQIRYHTSIIATDLIINSVNDYLNNRMSERSQKKSGRYYSFMPLALKKQMEKRFNNFCEKL